MVRRVSLKSSIDSNAKNLMFLTRLLESTEAGGRVLKYFLYALTLVRYTPDYYQEDSSKQNKCDEKVKKLTIC